MKTEIEVKFLHISADHIRGQLKRIGAVCEYPMREMRRAVFNTPEMGRRKGYLRLRDEGDKVTLTYKQFDDQAVDGAKEIEVVVSSFDDTLSILNAAGYHPTSYQESRRETWQYHGVEVVIDEWPWIDPYIEVEGESEAAIRKVAEDLGLDWDADAVFGSATVAYQQQFPGAGLEDIGVFDRICFNDPKPQVFKTK
ncbi:class IV adenylate cyclase [Candidatus Saccharibacteria bacterium]|nr:class IV adenylate cyclase [Candidatus Saccharibacteria bacterium]